MPGKKGKGSWQPLPFPTRKTTVSKFSQKLETGVNVAGAATLRQITGDVFKLTGLLTLGAVQGWFVSGYSIAAVGTLPVGFHVHGAHCCSPLRGSVSLPSFIT